MLRKRWRYLLPLALIIVLVPACAASPLASLDNLERLNLDRNQISDIASLPGNSGLGEGDQVDLKNNNLDLSENSEDMADIRQLEGRGVKVYY